MSPILDLQRRVMEVGRIRIGVQTVSAKGKPIPKRLETFRLTSRDEARIRAAADLLGGQVARWEEGDAWEVITDASELRVILIPGQSFSQWWETWGQVGGKGPHRALRRCDGNWDHLNDRPCSCPPIDERKETEGTCEPHTRLSVLLPDLPGIGTWRLETQSWYAAVELAGIAELLEALSARGEMRPARLRIDKRKSVNEKGETLIFPVPTLDVEMVVNPSAIVAPSAEVAALDRGETIERPAIGPAAAMAETRRREADPPKTRQGRQAAEIGQAGFVPNPDPLPEREEAEVSAPPTIEGKAEPAPKPEPEPEPEAPAEPSEEKVITNAQRRKVFGLARQVGVPEYRLREIVAELNGGEASTATFPARLVDALLEKIAEEGVPEQGEGQGTLAGTEPRGAYGEEP